MIFLEEDKNRNEIGIYYIRNKVNGKIYIGQTRDRFIERYWNHKWKLNNNSHDNKYLQRAWNKYGEDSFEFYVVHILKNDENIDDLEITYIDSFDGSKIYNIQNGGQSSTMFGVEMSESTKKKIGEKNKINGLDRKATEETKKKMSETRTGKTNWGSCKLEKEKIMEAKKLLINGMEMLDVSKKLNVDYKYINNLVCNNTYKSVLVEGWDEFLKTRIKKYKNVITEEQIIKMKSLLKQGYNQSETAKLTGVSRATVKKYAIE